MDDFKFENMTEREILIKQAGVLEKLCDALRTLTKNNKDEHKAITDKVEKVTDGKVSNWLFFPIISLIVLSIIGLTAYVGTMKNEVVKNTTCVE